MKITQQKIIAVLLAVNTSIVIAGEGIIPTPDYTGSLLKRSTLTGDWNGIRQNLAENGLQADLKAVTTYQNMFDGGIDRDDGFVSTQELQLDTGKADLWAGGLFKLRVQSRFGDALEGVGSFSPTNTNALFPNDIDHINQDTIAITELVYTQFLAPQFGIFAGLISTSEGDANVLAGNPSSTSQFMNASFLLSMGEFRTTPSSTLGAGLIFIPTDWLLGTFTILDSEESTADNPFSSSKGSTLSTEWIAKYELGGLPGAQTFGLLYAFDNEFAETDSDSRGSFPSGLISGRNEEHSSDSWAFYHNAHQYIQYENGSGWGVFTRFGIAERDTNPIDWSVAAGISGKGLFGFRPNDTFGFGYYHLQLTETQLFEALDMNDENGFEIWYNAEVTPWFHVTVDLQIIDTAFDKPKLFDSLPDNVVATAVGDLPEGESAWIIGVRTEINF
jgi:porin